MGYAIAFIGGAVVGIVIILIFKGEKSVITPLSLVEGLKYECSTQTISGQIAGNSPYPFNLHALVYNGMPTIPNEPPVDSLVVVERWSPNTVGSFSISNPNWPHSSNVTFVVWSEFSTHSKAYDSKDCGDATTTDAG